MTTLEMLIAADTETVARLGITDVATDETADSKWDNRPTWDNWSRKNFSDFSRFSKYPPKGA
jgi:hypothetical protein